MEETAKTLSSEGYEGIELRVRDLPEKIKNDAYSFWGNVKNDIGVKNLAEKSKEIRGICDKYKLEICALGTYLNCDEFDLIEEVCKSLPELGCSKLRVGVPLYNRMENYNNLYNKTIKDYKKVEKIMKKSKAKALLETHMGTIIPSASLAYRVASNFDPKYVGIIYDPGNMVTEGNENYKMGLELLGEYLSHVHMKNAVWTVKETKPDGKKVWQTKVCPLNEGSADLNQFADDLRSVGYNGWLSLEDFSDVKTIEKIRNGIRYIKSIL